MGVVMTPTPPLQARQGQLVGLRPPFTSSPSRPPDTQFPGLLGDTGGGALPGVLDPFLPSALTHAAPWGVVFLSWQLF